MSNSPYGFVSSQTKETPESMAIPGRESEMRENLAGGFSFKASDLQALRRWLLTGSMSDAFYQGKEEMTADNVAVLTRMILIDANTVASEIVAASKKGVSVHTPIFALAHLSTGSKQAKGAFREAFPEVVKTASHLYEFLSYAKDIRGFGSLIHNVVKDWIATRDAKELEYQFLKYQNRYGWAGRDVLRMMKPVPHSEDVKAVFNWIVGGTKKNPLLTVWPDALERINAYEKLKTGNVSEADIIDAINKYRMTWEMMPGNLDRSKDIWEALFHNMPVGATIRNLGNLTEKGIFESNKNLDILEGRLSKDNLVRAHIHPVVYASALKVYNNGGALGKSKLSWSPVHRVIDIMEDGIGNCFDAVEPTGKDFFYALDVSWSMTGGSVGTIWLSPLEVQGVMALSSIRSEKNYFVGGFSDNFVQLKDFTKSTSFSSAINIKSKVWPDGFGGTDASQAYSYATRNKVHTDVFVFMTDSESWAGYRHPSQALKEYRSKVNKDAKAIYITLVPYGDHITLADPNDSMSYDIAGFTSETPKLINLIARNEI